MINLSTVAQSYTSDPALSSNYTYTTTSADPAAAAAAGGIMLITFLVMLPLIVVTIIAMWKIFVKAGRPGWQSIVPIYSSWVLFEIVGYPGWWALLSLVPVVSIFPAIIMIIAYYKIAKLFGKSDGFAVASIFFPFVTFPMLAFGNAQFQGANSSAGGQGPQAPQAPYQQQPRFVNNQPSPQMAGPSYQPAPPSAQKPVSYGANPQGAPANESDSQSFIPPTNPLV